MEAGEYIKKFIPKTQLKAVFSQKDCDIDPTFIGFLDIYEHLSQIIPKHFTVIDFGCAYNPQCFLFNEHKKFIAVDISDCVKFKSDNCEIFEMSIDDFIKKYLHEFNLAETFAICSYVPDSNRTLRESFPNLFVYYPHVGFDKLKK